MPSSDLELLRRRFPKTDFTFTAAGISSTCSTTGAFRLQDHVLDHGPVDLFFVEFAVNDDQDAGHAFREALRGMEGVVRHTRLHNPRADIVIIYFVNPGMLRKWQANDIPISVRAHEQVAEHYGVPAINLALLQDVRQGKPLAVAGDALLNLIHVDDVVAAILAAENTTRLPARYNITDGCPVSRADFYGEIARQLGLEAPCLIEPNGQMPAAQRELSSKRVQNTRMLAELFPHLRYPSYREGLANVIQTDRE